MRERKKGNDGGPAHSQWVAILVVSLAMMVRGACADDTIVGKWTVSLQTPGGPLNFLLSVSDADGRQTAVIVNGHERIAVPISVTDSRQIVLSMEHYDSSIVLSPADENARENAREKNREKNRFNGQWKKQRGPGKVAIVPCSAARTNPTTSHPPDAFLGRWEVHFADSDDISVGVFERFGKSNEVVGTFLTTTGDYRFLHGRVRDNQLVLSCFDGAHAFLFKAERLPNGSLKGDFWSGNWFHDEWTAIKNPDAKLPDAFAQTVWTGDGKLSELRFPDLDGRLRSPGDVALRGEKLTLIEIFGSWCPNCHDQAAYLKELNQRYSKKGLAVLGLAFELTGDFERDARQVRRYIERFDIDYPVLIAGTADKAFASKAFPLLDRIRSYPTTLFVDARGTVRAVYTGFSGPATGKAHEEVRQRFEAIVEEVLSD